MTDVLGTSSESMTIAKEDTRNKAVKMSLKLSDIIYVISPSNEVLNNKTFFVEYIDEKLVTIVDVDTGKQHKIRVHKNGIVGDGSIQEVRLLERHEQDGYARQNDLLSGKWINIYFSGETPFVITAEITNLEEDMIELTTYPDNDVIYIDFAYKGIPIDLPIERIEIRRSAPKNQEDIDEEAVEEEKENDDNEFEETHEDDEDYAHDIDEDVTEEQGVEEMKDSEEDTLDREDMETLSGKQKNMTRVKRRIQEFAISADQRMHMFGDFLPPVQTQQRRNEREERYDIQHQVDDLLDDMVMKSKQKNNTSPETIRKLKEEVDRFIELRDEFSLVDEYGNVTGPNFHEATWKPLTKAMEKLSTELKWIVPVVKNIQRVEGISSDDITDLDIQDANTLSKELSVVMDIYNKGGNGELINHYRKYIDSISRLFQSTLNPSPEDKEVIASIYATSDIMTVVDNLGNFRSSHWGETSRGSSQKLVNECRMASYRYEEPSTFLGTRDDITDKIEPTPRENSGVKDLINIKSIITLPYVVAKFSKIDLPMTSLQDKIGYINAYSYYYKFLSKKARVQRIIVDKFQTGHSAYNTTTFDMTNMYKLNVNRDVVDDMSQRVIFKNYLDAVFPKTRKLLDAISSKATDKMSVKNYVDVLEPYLVYMKDITFSHYNVIKDHVSGNIKQYIDRYTSNVKEFRKIKGLRNTTQYTNKKVKSLVDNAMQKDIFEKYNKSGNNYSTSEYLSRIIQADGGRLFYGSITLNHINSLLHDDMSQTLNSIYSSETDGKNKNEDSNKCKIYMMTKQYYNKDELIADNNVEIYYDKKYDTTDYSLLIDKKEPHANTVEKFANEHTRMSADDFFDFIHEKVVKAVPSGTPDIDYLTETLIRGKKRVREGEYAMIFSQQDDEPLYYIRKNNVWKLDDSVGKETQFVTRATDCNLQKECIANIQENVDATCDVKDVRRKEIRANTLKMLIGLLDNQYFATRDELRDYILRKYDRDLINIDVIKAKRINDVCKYDNYQYKEGLKLSNTIEETIKSPHLPLLQIILSQSDNNKKYSDLLHFINTYTEEHTNQELEKGDPEEMLYCKTTKQPLLPVYQRTLASAWIMDDGEYSRPNFMKAIDDTVRKYGKESDDGKAWVDVNSGREIITKSFDIDEGYDESGYRNVSREVVTQDFETRYSSHIEKVSQLKKLYNSPETRIMFNIIVTLSNAMNVQTANIVEFVISLASSTLQKPGVFMGEKEYKKEAEAKAKEGEKSLPYKAFYDFTILYLTLGAFLIGIQTAIPGIISQKTYPGCIRSFSGYPFDDSGDKSSVEYLACVVKGVATSNGVWKIVNRKDVAYITKTVVSMIELHYRQDIRVKQKIHDKVVYLLEHPDEIIPESISVSKWLTFMPPVTQVNISKVENITDDYRKLFISDLKVGSPAQWKKLGVLQGKLIYFSLYPQKSIKSFLVDEIKQTSIEEVTSRGKLIPLFENGRLTAEGQMQPFSKKDCEIETMNNLVRVLETITQDNKLLGTAKMLTCTLNSKNVYPPLRKTFSEETIYLAFIDICDFARPNNEIDNELLPVCGDKPETFDKSDILSERIRKLKQDGHHYDTGHIERLLKINGLRNSVNVDMTGDVTTQLTHLANILQDITPENKYDVLKRHLELLLDTFDISRDNKISDEIRSLRNYLGEENRRLIAKVGGFMEDNITLNSRETSKMYSLLKKLTTWGAGEKERVMSQIIQYNCFDFIKRYADNFIHNFPTIILNNVNHKEAWSITRHAEKRLGLSNMTTDAINQSNHKYYKYIEEFYNNDTIKRILYKITDECQTLMKLIQHTPYFSSVDDNNSLICSILDKETCRMLFQYYMLNILENYVNLSIDKDMINLDTAENYGMEELQRNEAMTVPEVDPNMLESDMSKLQSNTARLMYAYISTMQSHRDMIDITYMDIVNVNFHTRESEKQMMTSRLEQLEKDDQLDLENIMRANGMGIWSKGLSKGLKKYVKETYDDEREFREKMQEVEKKVRQDKNVDDNNYQEAMDDYLDTLDNTIDEEDEQNDLSNFIGDDANGDPYADETDDLGYLD
jgi:hypothetical protein